MKLRQANLEHSDENIADQYPDLIDGLQKDSVQNANDARATRKYAGWKVIFKYRKQTNTLTMEDFGTRGMNEEDWKKFWQGPWHTAKFGTSDAGQRGQGRYLFHYFSKNKTVLAESVDESGKYRFGWGLPDRYDDEEKTLEDFFPQMPKLDHPGTRLWVLDIKKELQKDLLDTERFARYIRASWWEIIRNYQAVFVIDFDETETLVAIPDFPPVKKERLYESERIKNL